MFVKVKAKPAFAYVTQKIVDVSRVSQRGGEEGGHPVEGLVVLTEPVKHGEKWK